MLGDPDAERIVAGVVLAISGGFVIEVLPLAATADLKELPIAETTTPDVGEHIQAAVNLIARVGGLAESIGCVVKSCHVLVAERGYDVSHSTPALPFSVFVSVPAANERHGLLRLVESLIHESMHLQLTFLESVVPLVKEPAGTAFSPWKRSDRPVQGVLHGLYVFAVIYEALAVLAGVAPGSAEYAETRRAEIANEISAIGDARPSLTVDGVTLWDELVAGFSKPRRRSSAPRVLH